jgi:hypothetical protein
MVTDEAKELARMIFEQISELHEAQESKFLQKIVHDRCTAYQDVLIEIFQQKGFQGGVIIDPDSKVKDLDRNGHSIGIVQTKHTRELVAFDATIAQNGEEHWARKAKIWFGSAQSLSDQLREEFGGDWFVEDIEGAVLFTEEPIFFGEYASKA